MTNFILDKHRILKKKKKRYVFFLFINFLQLILEDLRHQQVTHGEGPLWLVCPTWFLLVGCSASQGDALPQNNGVYIFLLMTKLPQTGQPMTWASHGISQQLKHHFLEANKPNMFRPKCSPVLPILGQNLQLMNSQKHAESWSG